MLVNDIRKVIDKYDKEELKEIIIELYKRIPKTKREDYNIDDYIINMNKTKNNSNNIPFGEYSKEINYFIECVNNGYYVSPNKIISKKERSNWRFKVKKYYKELNAILPNAEHGDEATDLLIEIFKILSIGSCTLLFTNWETFRALGVSQSDYYDTIVKRILSKGYTKDNLNKCIDLLEITKSPYEMSYDMYGMLVSNLKTTDVKEMTIKLLQSKIDSLKIDLASIKDDYVEFYLKEDINDYVQCVLEINLLLGEYQEGIKYFQKNYFEEIKEIKEYVLLNVLESYDLKNEWIKEYESKKDKIKFRDSINEQYAIYKK